MEIKWPEKDENYCDDCEHPSCEGCRAWNQAIKSCKTAYDESGQAQRIEKLEGTLEYCKLALENGFLYGTKAEQTMEKINQALKESL